MTDMVTVSADDARSVSFGLTMVAMAGGAVLGQLPGFSAALEANVRLSAALNGAQMPEDPVGGPAEAAIGLHEAMLTYERAGFDHGEAFALVVTQVQAAANGRALRGGLG